MDKGLPVKEVPFSSELDEKRDKLYFYPHPVSDKISLISLAAYITEFAKNLPEFAKEFKSIISSVV